MPDELSKDPRVFFAAERTFLAWMRTGIALMGFGFLVARFGLFLRELTSTQHQSALSSPGFSLWIGTALVLIGVFVNISAVVRQGRLIQQLKRGEWDVQHQSRVGVGISITLACVGIAMAIHLSVMR
ncbi:MAG: YidH family protein [Bryobacteraceae bacterium]